MKLSLLRRRMNRSVGWSAGFGLALALFGGLFTAFSYWVLSNVPLTAFGLACIILSVTIMLVPSSPVPKRAIRAMVEESCVNVEALLEEVNATEKAFYLPPREGRVYAFVPLKVNPHVPDVGEVMGAPLRVVTKAGGSAGLMVFPPGSELIKLSGLAPGFGLEDGLRHVLVDFVEAVESVKAVKEGDKVIVDLVNPRISTGFERFRKVLGSPVASVVGCVVALSLGLPVRFGGEQNDRRRVRIVFKVLSQRGQA